jgi:PilZ domain
MKDVRTYPNDAIADLPPHFDRRSRDRIAIRIPLRVLSYGPLAEKSSDAVCTDLSEGGVAFDTASELTVGDIVILEFRLKGETSYRCHARLTYRMGRRYGGYFLGGQ